MLVTTWIVATLNPSILGMIETLGGPIIAMILFLMPMYAIQKVRQCVSTAVISATYSL
ncbi:serine transporter [Salmonella enterica subsp. enterica]|nr:serine transporter [Salmonella enterica subsp. enterica]